MTADRSSPKTLAAVLAVAALAIALRSVVYLRYEQLAFDSDQAITGLMAKHLVEGRAFPLFFYGQTYMLGVEAWTAAPWFLLFGPTVAALRLSLLAWNVAFGCLLVVVLHRDNHLSPWLALVPASLFLLTPASVASQLMSAQGGIVEPYVYVAGLWLLRRRPVWFGALLAVAFRNREFVAYAVPALLLVEWCSGELTLARVRDWFVSAVVFAAAWQAVEALKPLADLMGPGTRGQPLTGFAGSQIENLVDRFDFGYGELLDRAARMGPSIVKWFSGAVQIDSALPVRERPWLGLAAGVFLTGVTGRVAFLLLRSESNRIGGRSWSESVSLRVRRANFPIYLALVGAFAIGFFVAGKPVLPGYSRYVLLGIVCPVGLTATLLVLEPLASIRRAATALILAWALLSARDHLYAAAAYARHPGPDPMRVVADALVADGVRVASAGYWRAYVVTFFSRERLHVASQELPRIQEYQDEYAEKGGVVISDNPCPGGRAVGELYVCPS
jgi:hypothetical protein